MANMTILREVGKCANDTGEIDIVLVPGCSTTAVENWPFCDKAWLQNILPPHARSARLLSFDYKIEISREFSWMDFLEQGEKLLLTLSQSRPEDQLARPRPILFVCHSLGGLVLKQALCFANEQLHRYGTLLSSVAGIIFLGTPHLGNEVEQEDVLTRYNAILRTTTRKPVKFAPEAVSQEAYYLTNLAKRFASLPYRTPVLSVFESKKTKVWEGRASFNNQTQILVDKTWCETRAPHEQFLDFPLDHFSICKFQNCDDHSTSELKGFVNKMVEDVDDAITQRMAALNYQYAMSTTGYSPTLSERQLTMRSDSSDRKSSGAFATLGSSEDGYEVVKALSDSPPSRPGPKLPCKILDPPGTHRMFFGREDVLDCINGALLPPSTTTLSLQSEGLKQFALSGLGGLGKTEIAYEFALRSQDLYNAVFWVNADSEASLAQCYSMISQELGLEDDTDKNSQVVSRELVKGWLSDPGTTAAEDKTNQAGVAKQVTWLIIFNNADDIMALNDYWPMQGNGSILITSRDPLMKTHFTVRVSGIDLEALNDGDGAALLKRHTKIEGDENDQMAREISACLGGLPLAIIQMAGYIQRQDLTLSEFLTLYCDATEHPKLYGTRYDPGSRDYSHTMSTVWSLKDLEPCAKRMLEVLTFFHPDSVQEGILTDNLNELFGDLDPNPNSAAFREARTALLQSSLVKRNKNKGELSTHRLVQDVVQSELQGKNQDGLDTTFELAVRMVWQKWPSAMPKSVRRTQDVQPKNINKRLEVSRWPICAELYHHVKRLKILWHSTKTVRVLAQLQFAALLNEAAWYQSERGETKKFDGFFELALQICEKVTHPDRDSVLSDIHFCLGAIAADTNSHTASRIHKEKSFEIQVRISQEFGMINERLALSYSEISICRIQDGKYDEAVDLLIRERQIREELGVYVPLSREANLGLAYMLKGSLGECETLLERSLERRESVYGKNDKESFRTGRILYALGNLRNLQGRYEDGFECHSRALAQFRSTIGETNHRTADVCHKVAEHLIRRGDDKEAIDMINDALKCWNYDAEVYKPEIARTTFLKAKLMQQSGKETKASVLLKVACGLRRDLVSGDERDASLLCFEDFDSLVTFWSR